MGAPQGCGRGVSRAGEGEMRSEGPDLGESRGIFPGSGGGSGGSPPPRFRVEKLPESGGSAAGRDKGHWGKGDPPRSAGIRRDPPRSRGGRERGGSPGSSPPQKTGTLRRGNRRELGGVGPEFRAGAGVFRVNHWRRGGIPRFGVNSLSLGLNSLSSASSSPSFVFSSRNSVGFPEFWREFPQV